MRKVGVSLPTFDMSSTVSMAHLLGALESNDSQMSAAINELIDYVYMLEGIIADLQFRMDIIEDSKNELVILEELNKNVN